LTLSLAVKAILAPHPPKPPLALPEIVVASRRLACAEPPPLIDEKPDWYEHLLIGNISISFSTQPLLKSGDFQPLSPSTPPDLGSPTMIS